MNKQEILNKISNDIFTRQHILEASKIVDSSFKETQLRYLMGMLQNSNLIIRVGYNQYKKALKTPKKPVYLGVYSKTALTVIKFMENNFPLLEYRVWELSWLNEFFNHLIASNKIFLEVEREGCDFVFSLLIDKYPGKVLLSPKAKEILQYGSDDGIIINRLVTESPKSEDKRYQVPLEKLIVDLLANKTLTISKGEYPMAIEEMFAKYQIDQIPLFRYARRRNKRKELFVFLQQKTNIELLVEG